MKFILALLIVVTPSLLQGEEFWRSNAMGIPLQPIGWYRQKEHEWVLRREVQGDADTIVLMQNGSEQERWERFLYPSSGLPRRVTHLKNGMKESVQLFDALGRMTQEQWYKDEAMYQFYEFNYQGVHLTEEKLMDDQGRVIYTDTYRRTPQGRLRELVRSFPDSKLLTRWIHSPNGTVEEWHIDGERTTRRQFTSHGEMSGDLLYLNKTLVDSKRWVYQERALVTFRETDHIKEETYKRSYNSKGQLVLEEVFLKGKYAGESRWEYNKDGKETRRLRIAKGLREEWTSEYSENSLSRVEYRIDGVPSRETFYLKESGKQDVFYWQGEKAVEVYYEGEEKVREIYYSEGKPVRDLILKGGQ